MGLFAKTFLIALNIVFLGSCSTELKLQTTAVAVDCDQFPETAECVTTTQDGFSLDFKILAEYFVTNANSAEFRWEAVEGVAIYEIIVARNRECVLEAVSYRQFETRRNVGLLGVGDFYLCVYAMDSAGAKTAAVNNPVHFIVDREQPKIKASAEASSAAVTNTPKLPDITLEDATELKTQWSQKSGSGAITFADPSRLDSGITVSEDGTYIVSLSVTDEAGNITTRDFEIKVDTTPPVVNAGADITAFAAAKTLRGSYTGDAASIIWSMESGPAGGVLTFGNAASLSTTILGGVSGVYIVKLTATDGAE